MRTPRCVVALLVAVLLACWARGQCQPDWSIPGTPYGPGRDVAAALFFDDGTGEMLYAVLDHYYSSGPMTQALAAWDGRTWRQPPDCMVDAHIFAAAVYRGELVLAGRFRSIGGVSVNRIAAYDGRGWRDLGGGLDGEVTAMAVYHGELVVGGLFHNAGGVPVNYVAAWNGSGWRPAGSGIDMLNFDQTRINTLCVHNDVLYAGGRFFNGGGRALNHIAAWDGGGAWMPLSGSEAGADGGVNALLSTPQGLVIGGGFTRVGGISARSVCRFDGAAYTPLDMASGNGGVTSLGSFGGSVFAATGYPWSIVRWTGDAWSQVGPQNLLRASTLVTAFGRLLALGFPPTDANASQLNAAAWNGTAWESAGNGIDNDINSFCTFRGDLIAGGAFVFADGERCYGTAMRRSGRWAPLGGGVSYADGSSGWPRVNAVQTFANRLIAAGRFDRAGSEVCRNIAQWDGQRWAAVGPESGADGEITSAAVFQGDLYVAGGFTRVGGVDAPVLARWNGVSWAALPPLERDPNYIRPLVNSLQVFRDRLIVAGLFRGASGQASNGVIAWDGAAWSTLTGGLGSSIQHIDRMCVHEDELIAGGTFSRVGGVDASNVAAWNGSAWRPLGVGIPTGGYSTVLSLESYRGDLYAGGYFGSGTQSHTFRRWDGVAWEVPVVRPQGIVRTMREWLGQLHLGGNPYSIAGALVGRHVVLAPSGPLIAEQPEDSFAWVGGGASFAVSGAGSLMYQWRLNGSLLSDDPPRIIGAWSDRLVVTGLMPGDFGRYDAVVSDTCGSTLSASATLSEPCPADFDGSGGIDGADVESFFLAWESGENAADVDHSGGIDGADVETFFSAWEAGGCG